MSWLISTVLKTVTTKVVVCSNHTLSVNIELILNKMAKINTIGQRLKKRLNWNNTFKVCNMKNFSKILFLNNKAYNIVQDLLRATNFYVNQYALTQASKGQTLTTKILHKVENTQIELNQTKKNRILRETMTKMKEFFFINKKLNLEISNSFFPNFSIPEKNDRSNINYSILKKNKFLILSPKFFSLFIMNEIRLTRDKQIYNFSENFKNIVSRFCKKFLIIFKNNILGIKIVFSGKWKKTRTGRKQKLTLKFGKMRNNALNEIILFDWLDQKTKFGVCSLKIWINIRKKHL